MQEKRPLWRVARQARSENNYNTETRQGTLRSPALTTAPLQQHIKKLAINRYRAMERNNAQSNAYYAPTSRKRRCNESNRSSNSQIRTTPPSHYNPQNGTKRAERLHRPAPARRSQLNYEEGGEGFLTSESGSSGGSPYKRRAASFILLCSTTARSR